MKYNSNKYIINLNYNHKLLIKLIKLYNNKKKSYNI